MHDDIAAAVITFIEREVPRPRPKQITVNTDLRNDLRMIWEDAEDLLVKFFAEFSVDSGGFRFERYFPTPRFFLFNLKRQASERLTVGMLVDAAGRGAWPA